MEIQFPRVIAATERKNRDLAFSGRAMIITIQQSEFSWRSEYEIETPSCIYSAIAQKKLLSFSGQVKLFAPRERLVATIRRYFSPFRSKYDFELTDGGIYSFCCEKAWKGVYVCENAKESFHLYRHKGLNFSIFQNDIQVAAFTKNKVKLGAGDSYEIRLNDDANLLVIICMTLTIDSLDFDDESATVTYDFGNVGPEERPFDASCEPS
jgi:uncharacterized protein YxjI